MLTEHQNQASQVAKQFLLHCLTLPHENLRRISASLSVSQLRKPRKKEVRHLALGHQDSPRGRWGLTFRQGQISEIVEAPEDTPDGPILVQNVCKWNA